MQKIMETLEDGFSIINRSKDVILNVPTIRDGNKALDGYLYPDRETAFRVYKLCRNLPYEERRSEIIKTL